MAFCKTSLCVLLLSVPLALAATLSEVLSQTPELSSLYTNFANYYPETLAELNTITGATFFAPSNEAVDAFIATLDESTHTPEFVNALGRYHFLTSILKAADLSVAGGVIAETALADGTYANLGGGPNVIYASAYGSTGQDISQGPLKVYSGAGEAATVTKPDLEYDGGVVHVVDR